MMIEEHFNQELNLKTKSYWQYNLIVKNNGYVFALYLFIKRLNIWSEYLQRQANGHLNKFKFRERLKLKTLIKT